MLTTEKKFHSEFASSTKFATEPASQSLPQMRQLVQTKALGLGALAGAEAGAGVVTAADEELDSVVLGVVEDVVPRESFR